MNFILGIQTKVCTILTTDQVFYTSYQSYLQRQMCQILWAVEFTFLSQVPVVKVVCQIWNLHFEWLKVSKFQNESIKLSHCPKYEQKIWKCCPEYLGQNFSNFFVHILGNATTSNFRFEIYWPLIRKSTFCQKVTVHKDQKSPS